jgi:maleate isomerase
MTVFPFTLDRRDSERARLGLVVLQSDETIERDFRRLMPNGVSLYVTRVESDPEVTTETLARMRDRITGAAELLPRPVCFDTVGYGCTSGTSVIGVGAIAERLRAGCDAKATSEPVSALLAAAGALGLKRIAFLSPYVAEVSARLRGVLSEGGLESPVFGTFDEAREENVAWIDRTSIIAAATSLVGDADVDAVFLSCTNLRTLDCLSAIESAIGRPALSSNQVLCWHMQRLAGIDDRLSGYGRLFEMA